VVADGERRHAHPDRLDDAGRLVTEHGRRDGRQRAIDEAEVGVAHAAVRHAHGHLARMWFLGDDVVVHDESLTNRLEHRGAHVQFPRGSRPAASLPLLMMSECPA